MRVEVPAAPGPDTFCYRKASVLLRLRGPHGLLARHLVGARLLQDVGALLRADPQGELDRRIAFLADHVDVRAVPEQQLHHLRVAARRGVHQRRIAVLGDEIGVEVLGVDLLRVDVVVFFVGVVLFLVVFCVFFFGFFFFFCWFFFFFFVFFFVFFFFFFFFFFF